jgi:thiol-disulfide isomerase/thioredoxin
MKTLTKVVIVLAVGGLATAAVLTRDKGGERQESTDTTAVALPKVLDLGSRMCIPCQTMLVELDRLDSLAAGNLEVEFIDVSENPAKAQAYGISLIPTQIFLSETGVELWRHEGVISAEDMLAKWSELGYEIVPEDGR